MKGPKDGGKAPRHGDVLDRIFDRVRDAADGFHHLGPPAAPGALSQAGLPEDERDLWRRFDGLELAHGEARIFPLAEIRRGQADEGLRPDDLLIGERGRDRLVLPADPWAEGAAVVLVDESGERSPEASSVAHLVLGWLGEFALLYDEHGDFADNLFGDDGELTPDAHRRLCRRRLDLDPDAPNPRLRLAELLHQAGELRAARVELQQLLRRAPEFCWARHELGRVLAELGDSDQARANHVKAAEVAGDADLRAYFLAWAAAQAQGPERAALAGQVLGLRPEFPVHQGQAAASLIDRDELDRARDHVRIGLAVVPGHLELLRLRGVLDKLASEARPVD